jgi:phosphate starvation-inducible protein PhoH and related proteins
LNSQATAYKESIVFDDATQQQLQGLAGDLEQHIRHVERRLGVEIVRHGEKFTIIGHEQDVLSTIQVFQNLFQEILLKPVLKPSQVHFAIQAVTSDLEDDVPRDFDDTPITTKKGQIKPRGQNQATYLQAIREHDINFGIGPAGTGKTYLAVACAVEALERQEVRRILLTRPAVEAGERLGFLPGDLSQKVDPYLRPLYDALYEMLGFEKVAKLIEKHIIEIAPLAYMRGRTLNDAYIILDESQNTTPEQMKMFLTRIGFNSKAVITGDITQVDLPHGKLSGLRHVIDILTGVPEISFTFFKAADVVRHPVVQKVVRAYEKFEKVNP